MLIILYKLVRRIEVPSGDNCIFVQPPLGTHKRDHQTSFLDATTVTRTMAAVTTLAFRLRCTVDMWPMTSFSMFRATSRGRLSALLRQPKRKQTLFNAPHTCHSTCSLPHLPPTLRTLHITILISASKQLLSNQYFRASITTV